MCFTKSESAKKWEFCPLLVGVRAFIQIYLQRSGLSEKSIERDINSALYPSEYGQCMGDECMLWRFEKSKAEYNESDTGYCGLSGKPLPWLESAS